MNNTIETNFTLLFEGLVLWKEEKRNYSNGEIIHVKSCTYNDFVIQFCDSKVSTIYKGNSNTYREHTSLESLVKEVSESRQPLFAFSMF